MATSRPANSFTQSRSSGMNSFSQASTSSELLELMKISTERLVPLASRTGAGAAAAGERESERMGGGGGGVTREGAFLAGLSLRGVLRRDARFGSGEEL